uniref:Arabidopsis retrotransposon Orf1 C-terminal domain-containing protein n=1 Tax=Chenopodium quinoa TaxID=63459 RepID=A0A803LIV8_CHEQI
MQEKAVVPQRLESSHHSEFNSLVHKLVAATFSLCIETLSRPVYSAAGSRYTHLCRSQGKKEASSTSRVKNKEFSINYFDIDFNGDAIYKEKYEQLFRRGIVATRYGDLDVLTALHIEDDVRWLLDNVGLGNLLMTKLPTSQRATLEFLSSLKVNFFSNPSNGETKITFRLFNNNHTWTLDELNLALGLHVDGSRMTPTRWDVDGFWRILSGEGRYNSKGSSITSARHPALRYTLKLFSNTIFGRQEGSSVCKDELYMLHHILHDEPINVGAFLIQQLQHVANNNTTRGKIVQGGFITHGTYTVEIPCTWVKKKDGTTLWCTHGGEDALPSPEEMSLKDKNNWSFTHSSPRRQVSLSLEPPVPPSPSAVDVISSSRSPTLATLQASIDELKNDSKAMKNDLASLSENFATLITWLQSQGFSHPFFSPR